MKSIGMHIVAPWGDNKEMWQCAALRSLNPHLIWSCDAGPSFLAAATDYADAATAADASTAATTDGDAQVSCPLFPSVDNVLFAHGNKCGASHI